MATKSKSAPSSTLPAPLGEAMSAALKLLEGKKHAEAAKAFEALQVQAAAEGAVGLERSARSYAKAARARAGAGKAKAGDPLMEALLQINRGDGEGALASLDKVLNSKDAEARHFYAASTAMAIKGDAAASARYLKAAVALDPSMLYCFHLESDFHDLRAHEAFAFTR